MSVQTAITALAAEALEDIDLLISTETVRARHIRLVALRGKIASLLGIEDGDGGA